tara:strand:+ start:64 stop:219 length:156 start_codon:yes stop_codon:yes gene_type:complete
MIESFSDIHKRELFNRFMPFIYCPRCRSEDITIKFDEGYFKVVNCKKCGMS